MELVLLLTTLFFFNLDLFSDPEDYSDEFDPYAYFEDYSEFFDDYYYDDYDETNGSDGIFLIIIILIQINIIQIRQTIIMFTR